MTSKTKKYRRSSLILPPSPPPRNPFATSAKMRRGTVVHEKSRGAIRRAEHIRLRHMMQNGQADEDDVNTEDIDIASK